jgi:hypothetical protein
MNIPLEILEVAFDVSPDGVNTFEVYDTERNFFDTPPIYETKDLTKAVRFCYDMGLNFTVRPLAQWEREQQYNV